MQDDLDKIIKKVLREQSVIGAPNMGMTNKGESEESKKIQRQYWCVTPIYRPYVAELVKKGYNKKFIKVALGIIGRESDYGQSARYHAKAFVKFVGEILSNVPFIPQVRAYGRKIKGNLGSHGYGQMKLETAKKFNVDPNKIEGALVGAYRYMLFNYNIAKSQGYDTNRPSSNYDKGTGDAALDISIVGYNQGESFIHKYCDTSDPKLKSDCKNANKTVQVKYSNKKLKVTNKVVKNYLPYYKSQNDRHYTGILTSWGYVKEVANRMKKFNCF